MRVLLLGGNGQMGPHVVRALAGRHDLLVTDVSDGPADFAHEYRRLDAGDTDGVIAAAAGMDAIVNLSVARRERRAAFDVNTRGNYNVVRAAKAHGIRRIVNTGPYYQVTGPRYDEWDFELSADLPPQPGTRLYALSKALGQEILRVWSEQHDVYIQTLLFFLMRDAAPTAAASRDRNDTAAPGRDLTPFTIAWPETGTAVRAALEVELARLPSRCESYFVFPQLPHGKYSSAKIRRVLAWEAQHHLEHLWQRPLADDNTPR
jgi:hypothetical protein